MKKRNKIDCFKCWHFYITWDEKRPYGCRGIGFKSKSLPSLVVHQSSGMDCLKFEDKKTKKNAEQQEG